jgi:alpha-glucosidase
LGQAFNFDLLRADWDPGQFRAIIRDNLALAARSKASSTWVFSNHDVVRHATRYGLPGGGDGNYWLLTRGAEPVEDRELGARRSRAVTLLALALPGSAYLYQGEELGLPEVATIPDDARQDPVFFRKGGVEVGRDGCRVPLPWTKDGPSFGFGVGSAHLPQPSWLAEYAADVQEASPDSTLHLYRRALDLRRKLQTAEVLEWLPANPSVIAFRRPNGWVSVTNFGTGPAPLPDGQLLLASGPLGGDKVLPPDTTAWLRVDA